MWELSICCQSFPEKRTENFGLPLGKNLSSQLVVGKFVAAQVYCRYYLLEVKKQRSPFQQSFII